MVFRGQFARQQSRAAHVRFGSKADIAECETNVRFTPENGHWNSVAACPLCARSGHMHCNKNPYFITLLAATSSVCGTLRPSDLAVLIAGRRGESRAISCAARSGSGYGFDAATARQRWLCSNTRNINPCVMNNSGTIAVGMK